MSTMQKMHIPALIERVRGLDEIIEGGTGISWSRGSSRVRFDPETGEPYYYDRPASMTLSSEKLDAIVDLYTILPEILTALQSEGR